MDVPDAEEYNLMSLCVLWSAFSERKRVLVLFHQHFIIDLAPDLH